MSLYDFRTKPASQWTYYVIDDLFTMSNIYRFDTPEEAIQQYQTLDPGLRSAIGSSKDGTHELDHIQRRGNNTPVYVTDADRIKTSLWRESAEVQAAIDQMLSSLDVQHQLSSTLFGQQAYSVIVPLSRGQAKEADSYFHSSILYPDNPRAYRSAINEVFVMGKGWQTQNAVLSALEDRSSHGVAPDLYVERLNIRYLDLHSGYSGQADISPKDYELLRDKTEAFLTPEKLAEDLHALFSELVPDLPGAQRKPQAQSLSLLQTQIQSGYLGDFRKALECIIRDPGTAPDARLRAQSLHGRVMALIPGDIRRQLAAAKKEEPNVQPQHQQKPTVSAPSREEVR